MNLRQAKIGVFLTDTTPAPGTYARAFFVTGVGDATIEAVSTDDYQAHSFQKEDGVAITLPDLTVQIEHRVSGWLDEDHCSLRCIHATDPACLASRVAFIEKTPRVRKAASTNIFDDYKAWEEGPKGCAPEYGRYMPSRNWCDHRLVDLGYELPEGIPEGYTPPVQVSQLETYLSNNERKLAVAGRKFHFDNIRLHQGLGFWADVIGPRVTYTGMQVSTKVLGRPGAEVWEVMSSSGKRVVSFAIYQGAVLHVSY
ncbi:hypothetical protein ACYSUW_13135 [Pseudomonas frederiksbergensis]